MILWLASTFFWHRSGAAQEPATCSLVLGAGCLYYLMYTVIWHDFEDLRGEHVLLLGHYDATLGFPGEGPDAAAENASLDREPTYPHGLRVVRADGEAAQLRATWKRARRLWMWQVTAKPRWSSSEKRSEYEALAAWIHLHGAKLTVESKHEVELALREIPLPAAPPAEPAATTTGIDAPPPLPSATLPPQAEAASLAAALHPTEEACRLPAAALCEDLRSAPLVELLPRAPEIWRLVPPSQAASLARHLHWLWGQARSLTTPAAVAEAAWLMLLLWPRALLAAPPRTAATLAPHTRPREVRRRLGLLAAGDWRALLHGHTQLSVPARPAAQGAAAADGRRLLKAARQGHAGKAWRQLRSCGLHPADEATRERMAALLNPLPAAALPPVQPPLPAATVRRWFGEEHWTSTLDGLKRGRAFDALGWCSEHVEWMRSMPQVAPILGDIVQRYLDGSLPESARRLFHAAQLVPLRKPSGGLRPLALPTVLRKLGHSLLLRALLRPLLTSDTIPRQFGVMVRDGASALAAEVHAAMALHPHHILLQLDIRNAFPSACRHALQAALHRLCPEAATVCADMLGRCSDGLLATCGHRQLPLGITCGIPQGDPLSSALFAVLMQEAHTFWQTAMRRHELDVDTAFRWFYVDDLTLLVPADTAEQIVRLWGESLRQVGLDLEPSKTQLFNPSGALTTGWLTELQATTDAVGVVVCGLPCWDEDSDGDALGIPIGGPDYVQQFLEKHADAHLRQQTQLLDCVRQLDPRLPGAHLALHVHHMCAGPALQYIMRALPPETLRAWASRLSASLWEWLGLLLGTGPLAPASRHLLRLPAAKGGLAIVDPMEEASIIFLAAQAGTTAAHGRPHPLPAELAEATGQLEARWGEPLTKLGLTADTLRCGVRGLLPLLRARETQHLEDCLVADLQTQVALPGRPLAALLAAPLPGTAFLNDTLALTVRRCLRLPVLPVGLQCCYVSLAKQTRCTAILDADGRHAAHCPRSGVIRRHHEMRDKLAALAVEAGCHVAKEQSLRLPPLPADAHTDAEAISHRADLVLTWPAGHTTAVDVAIVHHATPDGKAMRDQVTLKRKTYHVPDLAMLLPGAIAFCAFVWSDLGTYCDEAKMLLLELQEAWARRLFEAKGMPWAQCHAYARQRVQGELQAVQARGTARMLRLVAPPEQVPVALTARTGVG